MWKKGIKELRQSLEAWGYFDRVIGITLTGQSSQEWISWDANFTVYPQVRPMIYSEPHRQAYRNWLNKKYRTIKDADLPTEEAFNNAHFKNFERSAFYGVEDENVVRYHLFRSELTVSTIATLADEIKAEFPHVKVGAIYGYMNEMGGDPSYGHNALTHLLETKSIDFINPMSSYRDRAGAGADFERQAITSIGLSGKLLLNDFDKQGSLGARNLAALCESYRQSQDPHIRNVYEINCDSGSPRSLYLYQHALAGFQIDDSGKVILGDMSSDVSQLRRFLGYSIARDIRFTFLSLWNNPSPEGQEMSNWSDKQMVEEIIPQIAQTKLRSYQFDRSSVAEILVISDEASNSRIRNWVINPDLKDSFNYRAGVGYHALSTTRLGLNRLGAPYDHVLLSDLPSLNVDRYKLIIFLNAWELSSSQRKMIDDKIKNRQRTVLWNYASGYFKEGVASVQNASEVIGINLVKTPELTPPNVEIKSQIFPLFSRDHQVAPLFQANCCETFYAADSTASILGYFANTQKTSMAIKSYPNWRSIWSITAALPPAALRDIARSSGVHIYSDYDEVFYSNKSFITFVARDGGSRTLKFQKPVEIYDATTETDWLLTSRSIRLRRPRAKLPFSELQKRARPLKTSSGTLKMPKMYSLNDQIRNHRNQRRLHRPQCLATDH